MLVFLNINGIPTTHQHTLYSQNSTQAQENTLRLLQAQHPHAVLHMTCICLQDHPTPQSAQDWFQTWASHLTPQH